MGNDKPKFIYASTCVFKNDDPNDVEIDDKVQDGELCTFEFIPKKVEIAKQVVLQICEQKDEQNTEFKQKDLEMDYFGLIVYEGFCIQLPNFPTFKVVSTKPKNSYVKITSITEFKFYKTMMKSKENKKESPIISQEFENRFITEAEKTLFNIILNSSTSSFGILLEGPSGIGKTTCVQQIFQILSTNLKYQTFTITTSNFTSKKLLKILNKTFQQAKLFAEQEKNVIIFLDEIDKIPTDYIGKGVITFLCNELDEICKREDSKILFIAASNNPSSISPLLKRHGRLDRVISFAPPNDEEREKILMELCKNISIKEVNFGEIASKTVGFVIGDLMKLIREASLNALKQKREFIILEDFLFSLNTIRPTLLQSDTSFTVEKVQITWDDIGGLEDVKLKLRQSAEWPMIHKEAFKRLGLTPPRGILLYGPPGCAKTTLVKALASSTNSTFLYLNSATIYSPYLGDAEETIRNVFAKARSAHPSIIFFDEIDSIVGKRDSGDDGHTNVEKRVLSTLLNEMDGIEITKDVFVVAATNRPDMLDSALMRPGRIEHVLYVPPPDVIARHAILQIHTKTIPLSKDVNLLELARECENFTGAELEGLCREAALFALREDIHQKEVRMEHFRKAKTNVHATITPEMLNEYKKFEGNFYAMTKQNYKVLK